MADEVKKLEIEELPARAKVIGEEEAEGVFGGAKRVKRGGKKRKPRKTGKKAGKKTGKKGKKRGKKRPKIGGGGKKRL